MPTIGKVIISSPTLSIYISRICQQFWGYLENKYFVNVRSAASRPL